MRLAPEMGHGLAAVFGRGWLARVMLAKVPERLVPAARIA
jgi:hypothetical protein